MMPRKINDINEYFELQGKYAVKGTFSNNYMLPDEVAGIIARKGLSVANDESNCWFFVRKEADVDRVYFYLNDMQKGMPQGSERDLVTELLFRGNAGMPETEISYLEDNGFCLNLRRDQYAASLPEITPCKAEYARSIEDAASAVDLINGTFDRYSGDYISATDVEELFKTKSLLCAYNGTGQLQGVLHVTLSGRNAWVSHLVVDESSRGKGVARKLMNMFVTMAQENQCKRLMLWVQTKNIAARKLYENYGFAYTNKSTISLIKTKD